MVLVPALSPQKGSKHFYFSTCRTESATHTLSAAVSLQQGPLRACVGDVPAVLPPNSKDPPAGKPHANQKLPDTWRELPQQTLHRCVRVRIQTGAGSCFSGLQQCVLQKTYRHFSLKLRQTSFLTRHKAQKGPSGPLVWPLYRMWTAKPLCPRADSSSSCSAKASNTAGSSLRLGSRGPANLLEPFSTAFDCTFPHLPKKKKFHSELQMTSSPPSQATGPCLPSGQQQTGHKLILSMQMTRNHN